MRVIVMIVIVRRGGEGLLRIDFIHRQVTLRLETTPTDSPDTNTTVSVSRDYLSDRLVDLHTSHLLISVGDSDEDDGRIDRVSFVGNIVVIVFGI
jgi:hypothetical protein